MPRWAANAHGEGSEMESVAGLTFGAPYILLALLALPAIWWLLRVTPPSPKRIVFPPLRFLLGLKSKEETPARTPWWLLALRLAAAAIAIVALAQPSYDAAPAVKGSAPLVIFIDNGWPAAAQWDTRVAAMRRALAGAERDGRAVVIVPTAEAKVPSLGLLDASRALNQAGDLVPRSWLPDRARAAAALGQMRFQTAPQILWLSDGLEYGNAKAVADSLAKIGTLTVFADEPAQTPLALLPVGNGAAGFEVGIMRAVAGDVREGHVAALDERGSVIEQAPFKFAANDTRAKATIALPLELRNDTARVIISGEDSAGAVQLLDTRYRRRPVGLVAGGTTDAEQPLLSDTYYIQRALEPFAELRKGTVAQMLDSGVAVLVLADIGKLTPDEHNRIVAFIERGGVLLRFAGPRLAAAAAAGTDTLVPVKLRSGQRLMGSALAWPEAQHLAPFERDSPFRGLAVPPDVTVGRQVLAEPSVELAAHGWARLADGTPLVTGLQRGRGWIVLFHVSASPGWSTLPLSGLYVEMLRRIVALSEGTRTRARDIGAASLVPYRTLDGFARLARPGPDAMPLKASEIDSVSPTFRHPPGLYGNQGAFLALNAVSAGTVLRPFANLGRTINTYSREAAIALEWPLLTLALILLLIDAMLSLWLRGHIDVKRLRRFATSAPILLLLIMAPELVRADETKNMAAALDTRLAYVITGNPDVDNMSRAGLFGLGLSLGQRTAYTPAAPIGIDLEKDDLSFYPLIYWPMASSQRDLSPAAVAKVNTFMRSGGTILFDTRDAPVSGLNTGQGEGTVTLRRLLAKLDMPPLEPVPADHVLTKTFYLLQDFPGRWTGSQVWIEAIPPADPGAGATPARGGDGVSPVIIGGNDWASAWARDASGRPLAAVVPGGEQQREISIRFGINLVMYALTGNYKTDQVHAPALLERLGQ
jgi:hypothetical protein